MPVVCLHARHQGLRILHACEGTLSNDKPEFLVNAPTMVYALPDCARAPIAKQSQSQGQDSYLER